MLLLRSLASLQKKTSVARVIFQVHWEGPGKQATQ